MKAEEKKALNAWDEFRDNIRNSTPVDLTESYEDKRKRIEKLEADPQAWKKYYFPKYFSSPSPKFHITASNRLREQFAIKRHHYEVRHWARGLSKTTTTMFDVLYLVMTGQLKNIGYISSTWDAANAFLMRYMTQLDSNLRLINDYGVQERPGMWMQGNFTTLKGVKFLAIGAGQSPRGSNNEEVRFDCLIMDDYDTDTECRNIDIINNKWDWFEKALMPAVDIARPYLVIWLGNVIAEDCCVVRAGAMADYCEVINIRDDYGKSVWPEKNSEEDIDYMLSKISWESAQQEFFNNPVRVGKAFPEMKWGKCPPINECPFVVIYADPATSNKDKPTLKSKAMNSSKAVAVIGHKGPYIYIYKAYVDNMTNAQFVDCLYFASKYAQGAKVVYKYIENNTLQDPFYEQVLRPLIHERSRVHGTNLGVLPDTRKKGEKWFRIEGTLEPLNREGHLILNEEEKGDPHMKRLESQFKTATPNSRTLDGPDCIEGGVHIIKSKTVTAAGKMTVSKPSKNSKRI